MYHGTVKWFNNAKGYGFIVSDSFNEDLFSHYSSINTEGYKTLKAGQAVTFDTTPGKNGLHAVDINTIPIEESNSIEAPSPPKYNANDDITTVLVQQKAKQSDESMATSL